MKRRKESQEEEKSRWEGDDHGNTNGNHRHRHCGNPGFDPHHKVEGKEEQPFGLLQKRYGYAIVMLIIAMGWVGCPHHYDDRDDRNHNHGHDYEHPDRNNDDHEHHG